MSQGDVFWIDDPDEKKRRHQAAAAGKPGRKGGRAPRSGRRWKWLLLLVVLLGLGYLFRAALLRGAATFLDVSDPVRRSDFTYVMAGRPDVRPFYAAALYRAGLTGAILVSRPQRTADVLDGVRPPGEELTAAILARQGVLPIDIVRLHGEVTSSFDEARALAAYLADKPTAQTTVVTSAYHTRRVRWIVRRTLGEQAVRVRYVGVPEDDFSPRDWWRSKEGFLTYVQEYLKIPYYWLVH